MTLIQHWVFGRCFLKNEQSLPLCRKPTSTVANNLSFHGKIRILENLSFTAGLTASQKLKDISHEIDGGIEECNFFLIFYNEMC